MTITATWNDSPTSPGYDISITGLATALNANPFFETNASNWTPTGGTFVRSTSQFHQGVASGLLTPDGVSSSVRTLSNNGAATAGTRYKAIGWVRCAATRTVNIQVLFFNGSGTFISSNNTTQNVTANTWTFLQSQSFTAPATTGFAAIQFEMTGTPSAGTTLFVDEAKLLTDYSYWKVQRQDLSGFLGNSDVRTQGADADGFVSTNNVDAAALSDYEFSFNTNIRYTLLKYNTLKQLVTSENADVGFPPLPTTAYYGHAWLKDVLTPGNSQPIIVGEFNAYQRETRVTLISVLGRQNPVPITDRLAGKSGSFTFYAMDTKFGGTLPTVDQYNALFNEGQILYFQSLSPQTVGWKDSYIAVTSVEFERLSLPYAPAETIFKYTIGFSEVDKPLTNTIDVSIHTWQQVLDSHDDWQDVLSSHTNWLDVYQDPQDLN